MVCLSCRTLHDQDVEHAGACSGEQQASDIARVCFGHCVQSGQRFVVTHAADADMQLFVKKFEKLHMLSRHQAIRLQLAAPCSC